MDNDRLLFHRLKEYAESGVYPFHMPGHKRNFLKGTDAFGIDITEIPGFDNLHHPEGILRESMEWAARIYGSDHTYYLVNGSSCGILSAVSAVVRPGGTLLMGRNCHKAAYHAALLNRLKTVYVYPQIVDKLGIQGGILAKNVAELLDIDGNIQAVLLVSPTYDGIVSDIREIAETAHRKGIPLIVDEAHGAHFPFSGRVASALDCGADIVIQSLHKTLPSLTQTAILHVRDGLVDVNRLERYLQIYQSSSPSYILMASAEQCVYEMVSCGAGLMGQLYERIWELHKALSSLQAIQVLDVSYEGRNGVFAVDETKLVLSVRDCFLDGRAVDGFWLCSVLRKKYQLEMEMAGVDYALAILTCMDREEGFSRLKRAVLEIDGTLRRSSPGMDLRKERDLKFGTDRCRQLDVRMTLAEAADMPWVELPLAGCEGRVSTEFVYIYPPGIPILAPGEAVTEDVICLVEEYRRRGYPVQGTADATALKLRVI